MSVFDRRGEIEVGGFVGQPTEHAVALQGVGHQGQVGAVLLYCRVDAEGRQRLPVRDAMVSTRLLDDIQRALKTVSGGRSLEVGETLCDPFEERTLERFVQGLMIKGWKHERAQPGQFLRGRAERADGQHQTLAFDHRLQLVECVSGQEPTGIDPGG